MLKKKKLFVKVKSFSEIIYMEKQFYIDTCYFLIFSQYS
jgi:hypothetical protein